MGLPPAWPTRPRHPRSPHNPGPAEGCRGEHPACTSHATVPCSTAATPELLIMASMYFQLAGLEGSSSQLRLVIVLWPPADLIIIQQRQHSPMLLLRWLPGLLAAAPVHGDAAGGGLHHPCHLPQQGAEPVQAHVFAKGVLGEKDGGRAWMVAGRSPGSCQGDSCGAQLPFS